jgi:NADH-quinone oxidoreductase subunit L
MTRQVVFVFFGNCRLTLGKTSRSEQHTFTQAGPEVAAQPRHGKDPAPHESPGSMLVPLVILATFSIALGFLGTPAWPWFQSFLNGSPTPLNWHAFSEPGFPLIFALSSAAALSGIAIAWFLYAGTRPTDQTQAQVDILERYFPQLFGLLRRKYFVDEVYDWAVVGFTRWWANACDWFDRWVCEAGVEVVSYFVLGCSWLTRLIDEQVVNPGFDESCRRLTEGGGFLARLQNGRVQRYLRVIAIGFAILVLILIWGCAAQ